ncbi:MAG: FAD binding domain-containing protein [Rhodospirillaceae bacterium]|nr:FAD binding domain-containing protein [Rhodospirillaceae bacterium]
MDALHAFDVIRPRNVAEMLAARKAHPASRLIGGGTDLLVNIRRGIEKPPVLIDTTLLDELRGIEADANGIAVGASTKLADLALHPAVLKHYPAIAAAADSIAGPTHRNMGTVGGNICLDTRCIYYNQSEWWRGANDHCLKTELGQMCHVAPKSKGVCFATFSGDLAPAFLLYGGEIDLAGPDGTRTVALDDFYIGYSRQDGSTGDGKTYLAIRPGEIVLRVRAKNAPGLVSAYDKIRIRKSIEYPVAGIAAALKRNGDTLADLRVAVTGTNPRPVRIKGTADLCGKPLGEATLAALDDLCRDQLMSMKTTFTPGTYRRRVATVMAKRLVKRLWEAAA